jgi:uncharacterized repeat protein (TIGR01451 family)
MRGSLFLHRFAALCLAASATVAFGQNAYQIFTPANIRDSTSGTGPGQNADVFNSKTLSLQCPSRPRAVISSSATGLGPILVDNFLTLAVGKYPPINICPWGWNGPAWQQSCYNSNYIQDSKNGNLVGVDPDTIAARDGVFPIDISPFLQSGSNQIQLSTVDIGQYLGSSSLYLVTSCTSNGVTGSSQITGNPIPSSNPTSQQLTQTFSVNPTTNQAVQFIYDLSIANSADTLTITNGSTPNNGANPLTQAAFQPYLNGTSFATAQCITHAGSSVNNSPACVLFTLTCQIGTSSEQSGANCPTSSARNEYFIDYFDGVLTSLPNITGTNGLSYPQGVGLLEAKEGWTGGMCSFDPATKIAGQMCPQNTLTSFTGPGAYRSGGSGQDPNSTFITVAPVPEPLTTITVANMHTGNWVNTHSPSVTFLSTPPALSNSGFVAAPIESINFGISLASSVPQPPAPISGDSSLSNSGACPAPGSAPTNVKPFSGTQNVDVTEDGQFLLHYYAQDCAGTQELQFTNTSGTWSTGFFTYPINVDTVVPVVPGITLTPAATNNTYTIGQQVSANYSCTDDRSGIVQCGTNTFSTPTLNTGPLTSMLNTSKAGQYTFTVNAVDAAGNTATQSVTYNVSSPLPPVNVSVLKLAPLTVKKGAQMTYSIGVANISLNAATSVTVTDTLPAGVTFVKATALQTVCSGLKCSNDAVCTGTTTVSCSVPSMTLLTPMAIQIVVNVTANSKTQISNTATVSTQNSNAGKSQSTAVTNVQ